MHWRWKWQPTPVFLPGESQGRGSLVRCCLWGHTESDTTEVTQQQQQQQHSSVGKESACSAGDPGSIPGSGKSAREGIGYLLQYSWASLVAQLVKNPPAMQETWFDPWVGTIPWRRERVPTPVFWPGEFHGLYSSRGCKESNTTE